ncbi:topoisomerase DNA-binding C4 zinc finger domain-containing protein [Sphingomonas sp.]|uniref:topoisomerase DNA-binding C4 zinc finger domain-containing protein n=1 Tax=Sphingomonas sp. TaxID=28214 RepID=UPI0025FA30B7|nr:topoisomerase DNA-binding C4 zinc finger domain-containing protein [Sphingomonas sp.]
MLFAFEEPDCDTLRAQVLRVFDGDGFLARAPFPLQGTEVEISVRCGFIDAPEMQQHGGEEARAFLDQQISGQWLNLGLLIKMDTGGMVDRHRRIVAVPYLWSDPHGWRNIELEMILNGWAWLLERYCPPEHYFDALEDAQRNRRGIWARDDNIHPGRFKNQIYRKKAKESDRPSPQSELFARTERPCPQEGCNGHLVQRSGRFGTFYGCSEFPKCRYARSSS